MKIDPTKKYRTRDGHEVTGLYPSSDPSKYPWVGAVNGIVTWWAHDGSWQIGSTSPFDLVEVPPEPPAFDPTKPVQTRDGRKAGIYSTDNRGPYPIHAWVENPDGFRFAACWTSAGRLLTRSGPEDVDLVNIPPPPPRAGYVNVYPEGFVGNSRSTRTLADGQASPKRIACVKWTEGQFDE